MTEFKVLEAVLVVDEFPDVDRRLTGVSSVALRITHQIIELGIRRVHV